MKLPKLPRLAEQVMDGLRYAIIAAYIVAVLFTKEEVTLTHLLLLLVLFDVETTSARTLKQLKKNEKLTYQFNETGELYDSKGKKCT